MYDWAQWRFVSQYAVVLLDKVVDAVMRIGLELVWGRLNFRRAFLFTYILQLDQLYKH